MVKISYERRVYESVDEKSLYILDYNSKFDEIGIPETNGLKYLISFSLIL